jgi:hypothetical protein
VFLELAQKFQRLVDVLNDVAEMAHTHTDRDILRLYEIWLKTGSPRAFAILQRLGVRPSRRARARNTERAALRRMQTLLAQLYDAPVREDVQDFV